MTLGVSRILRERKHQLTKYDCEHDADHQRGELAQAASFLAWQNPDAEFPKWAGDLLCKNKDYPIRLLAIAGALIAAEIDRLIDDSQNPVRRFARAAQHGTPAHKEWLLDAAECFLTDHPLPEKRE